MTRGQEFEEFYRSSQHRVVTFLFAMTGDLGDDATALVAALRLLPPDQRLAVVQHHLLDLPVAEIARQSGTPENTVKSRLSRGRRRLAELLDKFSTEENAHA